VSTVPRIKMPALTMIDLAAWVFTLTDAEYQLNAASSAMSASLIGRLGSALSGCPPLQCRCLSRARASLRNRHQGPSIMGFEDEVEQSFGRPCRHANGRSKRPCELTSSIVPRGTSFHHAVELEFSPIGFEPARFSCCCGGLFPRPAELGAVDPDAVHDYGQPTRQRHDRLFYPAAPRELRRPRLVPGPFLRMHQQAFNKFP
jgi:hypothetical protein